MTNPSSAQCISLLIFIRSSLRSLRSAVSNLILNRFPGPPLSPPLELCFSACRVQIKWSIKHNNSNYHFIPKKFHLYPKSHPFSPPFAHIKSQSLLFLHSFKIYIGPLNLRLIAGWFCNIFPMANFSNPWISPFCYGHYFFYGASSVIKRQNLRRTGIKVMNKKREKREKLSMNKEKRNGKKRV
jgi:hypothetical protein